MFIENSQDNITIDLDSNVKTVGLKISGGVDSAIVGYMLTKYVHEERPDIRIIPITVDQVGKAFQVQFAKRIIEFYKQKFGDYFLEHRTGVSEVEETDYSKSQASIVHDLYNNGLIQAHFVGMTLNPPSELMPEFVDKSLLEPPDRLRTGEKKQQREDTSYRPLINIDKRGVAEIYDYFGVRDTLFPLTRSCEAYTDDFSNPCGKCWFCGERYYGFETC